MKFFIVVLCWLSVLFTIIPFIKRDAWWIRIFDYPKIQFTAFSLFCLLLHTVFIERFDLHELLLLSSMVFCVGYHSYLIFPYTFLASKQSLDCKPPKADDSIKLLIFNVYMHNRDSDKILKSITTHQPDLIFLVETDYWWSDQVAILKEDYPFSMAHPVDNTYGMLLFSKYDLTESKVEYLMEDDIPSFHTKITLPSGQKVQFYGLHPKPPVPGESLQSTERDAELLMVGKKVRHQKMPVLVAGDLNDVAWSYTSKLFLRISELLDPRVGRGFYNSFHARNILFRCPLDHVFHSNHFKLVSLKRLSACGSDHFPILIELCYQEDATKQQKTPTADEADKKLAVTKINAV